MDVPKKPGKKKKSYGGTARKGAAWSIVRQGGHELIAVPMSMIMARLLSPQEFGVAVAASFFVLLSARLTQFGFNAALVRIKELREEHVSSVLVANLAVGVLSYGVLFVAAPAIGRFFNSPDAGSLVRLAALTFLISPLGSVSGAMIARDLAFRKAAIVDWTDGLVGAIVTIGLALNGWSYWSIPLGNVVASVVRVIVQAKLAGMTLSFRWSRQAISELLSYGFGVHLKRLLEYSSANLDNLVVGKMLDLTSLGLYDKAFSTMGRLVNRLTLGQAPFRIFAIIHGDEVRFRRAYTRLILSITMIGYPAFAFAMVAAGPLFDVLYGSRWSAAVLPFQVMCVGGMFKHLNAYASQANEAAGGIWGQVRRQAVGLALIVVGAAIGTHYGGITGAAIGVTAATVILTVAMQDLVRRITGLSWWEMVAPQVPAAVCGVVVGLGTIGAAVALRGVVGTPPAFVQLLVQSAAAALLYGVFVLFAPLRALRELVAETASEVLPARVLGVLGRLGVQVS
jgi:O-antigen/teichoic acid export membrane protein